MADHTRHGMPSGYADGRPLLQAMYDVRMGTAEEAEDWAAVAALATGPADEATLADRRAVDQNGNTRLHNCIWDKAPLQTIRALIAGYPEAVMVKSNFGQLPLDLAISADLPIVQALVAAAVDGLETLDDTGRSFRDIVATANSEDVRRWARTHGAFLGRYQLTPGPAIHMSGTARSQYATDVIAEPPTDVCLKHMRHRHQFEIEINTRATAHLSHDAVIGIRGWHTPVDEPLRDANGQRQEPEPTGDMSQFRYVLVMEKGERSLHDVCAKERMAGYDLPNILTTFSAICKCVLTLHAAGMVHGDIKQRNILRFIDNGNGSGGGGAPLAATRSANAVAAGLSAPVPEQRWVLCDMDAAGFVGKQVGSKTSSAYAPPELARVKVAKVDGGWAGYLPSAALSFDVWSLGVVLFELCAGRTLFAQDTNNDELVDLGDWTRLCTWDTITDWELSSVFKPVVGMPAVDAQHADDAKHLIRWCLKGDPVQRPTVEQILAHRIFNPSLMTIPVPLPMRYHCFLSHAQADASGTAGDLFHLYRNFHLHAWLDMKQQALTLDGMRQGVRDSNVFILVLSENVLTSWFCQQEILCAVSEGKRIQLVLEEEPRFKPFNLAHWQAQQKEDEVEEEEQDAVAGAQTPRTIRMIKDGKLTDVIIEVLHDPEDPWQVQQGDILLTHLLCKAIDQALPESVNYRRRDFEQEAMMRELCHRNGVVLPRRALSSLSASESTSAEAGPNVFVIYDEKSGAGVIRDLTTALEGMREAVHLVFDPAGLDTADKILAVLTDGVLSPNAPSLAQLSRAIETDQTVDIGNGLVRTISRRKMQDRIVMLHSERNGWSFSGGEVQRAPGHVQQCLADHESIAFREPSTGRSRHEFSTMLTQLLRKLGVAVPSDLSSTGATSATINRDPTVGSGEVVKDGDLSVEEATCKPSSDPELSRDRVCDRLAAAEQALAAKDSEMAAQKRAHEASIADMQAALGNMSAQLATLKALLSAGPPEDDLQQEEGLPPEPE